MRCVFIGRSVSNAPPGKKKAKSKAEASSQAKLEVELEPTPKPRSLRGKPESQPAPEQSTSRAATKRKFTEVAKDSEASNGNSESEVQSIIDEPVKRGRPKRHVDDVEPAQRSSPRKSRQRHQREADASDEETVSTRPTRASSKREAEPSASRTRSSRAKPKSAAKEEPVKPGERSPRRIRASASRAAAPSSTRVSSARRASASSSRPAKRQKPDPFDKDGSSDEMVLGDDDPVPAGAPKIVQSANPAQSVSEADAVGETDLEADAMQVDYPDTGAEADVEDEIAHLKFSGSRESLEIPSSDVAEQSLTVEDAPAVSHEIEEAVRNASPERPSSPQQPSSPKIPAHRARAANPRVKLLDDTIHDDGPSGISTKARITARMGGGEAGPSSPTKTNGSSSSKSSRPKPGPGRSSSGLQLGSTSLLTVVKRGTLETLKRIPFFRASQTDEVPESPDEDSEPDPLPAPTGKELLEMAGLDIAAANELPDYEEDEPKNEPDSEAAGNSDPNDVPMDIELPGDDNSKPTDDQGEGEAEVEGAQTEGTDAGEARSVEKYGPLFQAARAFVDLSYCL